MRKRHAFRPTVNDRLEDRCVPSHAGHAHVARHHAHALRAAAAEGPGARALLVAHTQNPTFASLGSGLGGASGAVVAPGGAGTGLASSAGTVLAPRVGGAFAPAAVGVGTGATSFAFGGLSRGQRVLGTPINVLGLRFRLPANAVARATVGLAGRRLATGTTRTTATGTATAGFVPETGIGTGRTTLTVGLGIGNVHTPGTGGTNTGAPIGTGVLPTSPLTNPTLVSSGRSGQGNSAATTVGTGGFLLA